MAVGMSQTTVTIHFCCVDKTHYMKDYPMAGKFFRMAWKNGYNEWIDTAVSVASCTLHAEFQLMLSWLMLNYDTML